MYTHKSAHNESEEPCWAIIAHNIGQGCVLAYGGGATLRHEIEEVGCRALDDLGLDDAPEGISVWEGRYTTTGNSGHPGYYDESMETHPFGRFRALTDDDWRCLREQNHEKIRHTTLLADCPRCGAKKIRAGIPMCSDCELAEACRALLERDHIRTDARNPVLAALGHCVDVLDDLKPCDHSEKTGEHDAKCMLCRVEAALAHAEEVGCA